MLSLRNINANAVKHIRIMTLHVWIQISEHPQFSTSLWLYVILLLIQNNFLVCHRGENECKTIV